MGVPLSDIDIDSNKPVAEACISVKKCRQKVCQKYGLEQAPVLKLGYDEGKMGFMVPDI